MGDVPTSIPVDPDTGFGAAEGFVEAVPSADGAWLAVVTIGVAHSAGWLVQGDSRQPEPAAFQYGGSIAIGPWSDDAQHAVFVQQGPAGDQTLTVVDRERLGDTVASSAVPVRVPDHDRRAPEKRIYEAVEWRDGDLLFALGAERWIFRPETGEVRLEE